MNTFTHKFLKIEYKKVKDFFEERNAALSAQQYAVFKAAGQGVSYTAVLYESGKFVLQGKDVSKIAAELCGEMGIQLPVISCAKENNTDFKPHIGVDESGKGDYFGPLVIAGVYANEQSAKKFLEAGIKDSKKLTDDRIQKLAGIIKANSIHTTVVIGNEKYNELYEKFNNLNKLLAWGHARVIENLLEKTTCEYALSDKFGNNKLIENALMDKGRKIRLEQRVRAEEDIAVAAASVLARAEYVSRMKALSNRYETELPKGASDKVLQTAKKFVSRYGQEKLKMVAKLHFKTTQAVNGKPD